MKTSNFANNNLYDLKGISISRHIDRRTAPRIIAEFPPLFPQEDIIKGYREGLLEWDQYKALYLAQLSCLNASSVYLYLVSVAEANDADEPILLGYESAKTLDTKPSNRRIVADWIRHELNIEVPEWNKILHFSKK